MSAFHRELYELPWDRRRFSAHRARVQSAGFVVVIFSWFSPCECGNSDFGNYICLQCIICLCFCWLHFNNVQVPGLTVLLHQVVTSLISGNCIRPLFTFMQMEFAAISGNCSHSDGLFPLFFFANGALSLPSRWPHSLSFKWSLHQFFSLLFKKAIILTSWSFPNQGEKKEGAARERKTGKYSGGGITILLSLVYCKSVWKGICKKYPRFESLLRTS